jgi:hypothetical protein
MPIVRSDSLWIRRRYRRDDAANVPAHLADVDRRGGFAVLGNVHQLLLVVGAVMAHDRARALASRPRAAIYVLDG